MKIDKKRRKSISDAQYITDTIADRLKESGDEVKDKVDLTKLAEGLADRRAKVESEEE